MKSRCIARFFLFLSVTFLLLEQTATRCAGEGSPAPIDVGSRKQLFIDERFIAASALAMPAPTFCPAPVTRAVRPVRLNMPGQ